MNIHVRRLSPAMLVALAALFVAIGSGSFASAGALKPFTQFKLYTNVSQGGDVKAGQPSISVLDCPSGYLAISGGFAISGSATITVTESNAVHKDTAWRTVVANAPLGEDGHVVSTVQCMQLVRG